MIDRRLQIVERLETAIKDEISGLDGHVSFGEPPSLEEGAEFDLAIPCFQFAKKAKLPPHKIAENLKKAIDKKAQELGVAQAKTTKAYLNIEFDKKPLGESLVKRLTNPLGETSIAYQDRKYIVEFSSPNIAKPFGIGHLRSTNIGAAIARIEKAVGAEVIRINHLGDWGTQFGKLITAYKHFGSADFVKGDVVNNLYKLYVEYHQQEAEDPALLDEAREWFVKLENGDEEATELWTWFKDVSYQDFKKLYERLGVDFDFVTGESFYKDLMPDTVRRLKEKGLVKESEGALIVDLEDYEMTPCLIEKSDGSTLYATRDLATAEYRARTFEPSHFVYVVGQEQKLHFRQFFKVLELMGYPWATQAKHVDFGLIRFPEGKMSTRKGNIILLEKVLDQAKEKALEVIEQKDNERDVADRMSEEEKDRVSEIVGTGAVIFFDLKAKRTKDVQFDWDEILNFEGDSGPYLQYTGVRLEALLRKAKTEGFSFTEGDIPQMPTLEERALVQSILGFANVVETAARDYEPSMISHGLLELAAVFNRFYMNVKILKGEDKYRAERLLLVKSTLETLRFGLGLLGIEIPERM